MFALGAGTVSGHRDESASPTWPRSRRSPFRIRVQRLPPSFAATIRSGPFCFIRDGLGKVLVSIVIPTLMERNVGSDRWILTKLHLRAWATRARLFVLFALPVSVALAGAMLMAGFDDRKWCAWETFRCYS